MAHLLACSSGGFCSSAVVVVKSFEGDPAVSAVDLFPFMPKAFLRAFVSWDGLACKVFCCCLDYEILSQPYWGRVLALQTSSGAGGLTYFSASAAK